MNSKTLCNGKMAKKCAFCKHWYDPLNHVNVIKSLFTGID